MPAPISEQRVERVEDSDEFEQVWHEAANAPQKRSQAADGQQRASGRKQAAVKEEKRGYDTSDTSAEGNSTGSHSTPSAAESVRPVDSRGGASSSTLDTAPNATATAQPAAASCANSESAAAEAEWGAVNDAHTAHIQQQQQAAASDSGGSSGAIRQPADANCRFSAIHASAATERLLADGALVASTAQRVQPLDLRCLPRAKRIKYTLLGAPKLRSSSTQRQRLLCCALVPLDRENVLHERVLVSLYRGLLGSSECPPVYGSHWEAVGFQGADPATDVRGAGVLGLLLTLALVQQRHALAQEIFKLSTDAHQHFPFCVVALNVSGFVLSAVRSGSLNSSANRSGDMWRTANGLFAAAMQHMHNIWKGEGCTIMQWNDVRQSDSSSSSAPQHSAQHSAATRSTRLIRVVPARVGLCGRRVQSACYRSGKALLADFLASEEAMSGATLEFMPFD